MPETGRRLKERQKSLGLKDHEVLAAMTNGSIDTLRKLGRINMSPELLAKIEAGIESARLKKLKILSA